MTTDLLAPCDQCGGLVDLSAIVTVSMVDDDGTPVAIRVSEYEARQLLDEAGVPRPPVMCSNHEPVLVETSR